MSVSDIIEINIDRQTAAVSQAGFGTLMILGNSASGTFPFADRIRYYSDLDGVAADFTVLDEEYIFANSYFSQSPKPAQLAIGRWDSTAPETVTAALDAIEGIDSDWYAAVLTDRTKANQLELATWIEARSKIAGVASSDSDIVDQSFAVDNSSIAYQLNNSGFCRTFVLYHDFAGAAGDNGPDAAWFGAMLPRQAGSATWAFKTLATVSAVLLTSTQRKNALDKSANTYENRGGVNITRQGTMACGEYIDIMRGIDWFEARLCERILSKLVNLPKIPYTDAGIAIVEAEVRAQISDAIDIDFAANDPEPVVTVPLARNVPANDKALRRLNNVEFCFAPAGAIHFVQVNGKVTFEF